MEIEDGPPRPKTIFSKWPHQRSKVIQRSSCLRNALWLPNLAGRPPDQRVMHCWGQRSWRGHPGVKLLRNALWPPNLVERIPDQSIMHCWGQRSCRGQLGQVGVNLLTKCPMATKFDGKNPWPEHNTLLWSKVVSGSAGVKKGSICLGMPYGHQIWWEEPLTRT